MRTILAVGLAVVIWALFTRIAGFLLVQLELLRSDFSRDFIEFAVAVGCSVVGVYLSKLAAEKWVQSYRRRLVAIPFGIIVLINLYLEFVAGWGPSTPVTTLVASVGIIGAAYLLFWRHQEVETVTFSDEQNQNQLAPKEQDRELDEAERYILSEVEKMDDDGDDDLDLDMDDEDFLEDDPIGLSPKEQIVYDLDRELEAWPDEKAELAHRFIKCVVLRESEEKAKAMAREFTPDQFKFLQQHIADVLRLYGNS